LVKANLDAIVQDNTPNQFLCLRFESAEDLLRVLGDAVKAVDLNGWRFRLSKFAQHYDDAGLLVLEDSVASLRPLFGASLTSVALHVDVVCPALNIKSAWITFSVTKMADLQLEASTLEVDIRRGASPHHTLPELSLARWDRACRRLGRAMRVCCATCAKTERLRACEGCEVVRYCNQSCQKADYRSRHKLECAQLQALATAARKLCRIQDIITKVMV